VDAKDDVYVVDWQNYQIRKITLSGQPVISAGGVVNAASLAGFPAPVAPGSLIVIRGLNLAGQEVSVDQAPWPLELSGVSVEWNGRRIPLSSVGSNRIGAQVPMDVEVGSTASVVVRTESGVSNVMRVRVEGAAPGLYASTLEGPVERGGVVVLKATGLGVVSPAVDAGQGAPSDPVAVPVQVVTASVGGVEAEVVSSALVPSLVGIAEVRVRIPEGVDLGSEVPVLIRAGGLESNVVTIAVR
jgi:uncharacterized protein (TIGR03437 family)